MKTNKLSAKLSLLVVLLVSFVIMFSTGIAMLVRADSNTPEQTETVTTTTYTDDWYEISVNKNSLTILLDGSIGSYRSLSRDDIGNIKNALLSAVQEIIVNPIFESSQGQGEQSGQDPQAYRAVAMTIDSEYGHEGDLELDVDSLLAKYEDYLKQHLSKVDEETNQPVELQKFLNGEYDSLVKYAVSQYVEKHPEQNVEELVQSVQEQVQGIVDEVIDNLPSDVVESTGKSKEDLKGEVQEKVETVGSEIQESGGKYTLSLADILQALKGVNVGGYQIYSGSKFVLGEIRQLLSTLPRPAEIAEMDKLQLTYKIVIETTFGSSSFNLTVGLKGNVEIFKKAAAFIASHVNAYVDDGVYTLDITVPDEFTSLVLKLANTTRIPDKLKHAVFGLFDKTGDEIVDKATSYSLDEILEYIQGHDFHKIFSALLDAQKLNDFFGRYGVDLSKVTQARIDRLLNLVVDYAEKVANKKTVEGIEALLQEYGVPGIPAQLEEAVQRFLNLLNKIDYKYWDAETIKEFVNNADRFNSKVNAAISRVANSATAEKIYNKFVDYAVRVFNKLPSKLHNGTLLGLYDGDSHLSFAGNFDYDVRALLKRVLDKVLPYVEKLGSETLDNYAQHIEDIIDEYFTGDMSFNFDLALNVSTVDIYRVDYMVGDQTVSSGLLPVGADVGFFANMTEVNGYKIVGWAEGDASYTEMPGHDAVLQAVTEFDAELQYNGEVAPAKIEQYFGDPIELNAVVTHPFITDPEAFNYIWYKDGEVYDAPDSATLTLQQVEDSGTYYCHVVYAVGDLKVEVDTEPVEVIINKVPAIDLTDAYWQLDDLPQGENTVTFDGKPHTVHIILSSKYNDEEMLETYQAAVLGACVGDREKTDADKYTITPDFGDHIEDLEVLNGESFPAFDWEILPAVADFTGAEWQIYANDELVAKEDWGNLTYQEGVTYTIVLNTDSAKSLHFVNKQYYIKLTGETIETDANEEGKTYKVYVTIMFKPEDGEEVETNNYTITNLTDNPFVWTINKYVIDLSNISWQLDGEDVTSEVPSVTFDGKPHTVALKFAEGYEQYEDLVDITYGGDAKTQTNANTYTATATFVLKDKDNYKLVGGDTIELNWEITKYVVSLVGLKWTSETTFTYKKGTTYSVALTEESLASIIDYVDVAYEGESAEAAGTYHAKVTITLKEEYSDGNYELKGEGPAQLEWTIIKATVSLKGLEWTSEKTFTYEKGTTYSVALTEESLASIKDYVDVAYEGESAEAAGTYHAKVTITLKDKDNYQFDGDQPAQLEWKIEKATVSLKGLKWTSEKTFTYEKGTTYSVALTEESLASIKDYVDVAYEGESAEAAGTYHAKVTITLKDKDNYQFDGDQPAQLEWKIEKATVSLKGLKWTSEKTFTYEKGTTYSVALTEESLATIKDYVDVAYEGESAEAAGTYHAKVTITLKDKDNYQFDGDQPAQLEWKINKAPVNIEGIDWAWDYDDVKHIEFDGNPHSVTLTDACWSAVAEYVKVNYSGDKAKTEVGNYSTTATVSLKDVDNYELKGAQPDKLDWQIDPANIDFAGATWSGTDFTYDGNLHEVTLNNVPEMHLASGYAYKLLGTKSETEAGTYEVTAAIVTVADEKVTDNYAIINLTVNPLSWTISPKAIDITGLKWGETSIYGFTGDTITIKLDPSEESIEDRDKIDIGYSGNAQSIVGVYNAVATVTVKPEYSDNYVLDGETELTKEWAIVPVQINGWLITWDYTEPFEYDGNDHTVQIINPYEKYKTLYGVQFEVTYTNNTGKEIGKYTATAKIAVLNNDDGNYEIINDIADCEWEIVAKTEPPVTDLNKTLDDGTTVDVAAQGGALPAGSQLNSAVSQNEYTPDQFKPFVKSGYKPGSIVKVYSIDISGLGSYAGSFAVSIQNPDFLGKDLIVVHVPLDADGKPVDAEQWMNAQATLSEDALTFNTDHFSDFVVIEQVPQEVDNLWWVWLLVAIIIILLTIIIILIIVLIRSNKNSGEPDDNRVIIINTEEVAEEPKEEPQTEPVVEEEPVVEPEEPAVEEVPAEPEQPDETAVAEEAPAEIAAPETTPVVLAPLGAGERYVMDKSFTARLSQADDSVKQNYSELKNYILSYKGVRSRISWHFDSFNKGRNKCLKLQIRGKSMYMYIALNPAEVEEKYHAKDVSDKTRYADVPTMLKIRKPRSLKYAKQLVDKLMASLEVPQGDIPNTDYKPVRQSNEAFLQLGYIKIKVTKRNFHNIGNEKK